jgi:hypothetical protein
MESSVIWDIMPCNTLKVNQQLVASIYMIEEHSVLETSTEQAAGMAYLLTPWTTQWYIPQNRMLYNSFCDSVRSYCLVSGQDMKLTIHLHLTSRLGMCRAIPSLPNIFMVW